MVIATATSRITGFLRQIALTAAIGLGLIGDAYNTANYLPNVVYELLLGGVLTSVVVPLLVHAQQHDRDGGEAYAQRLISVSTVMLLVAAVVTIIAAPWLTDLFGISGHTDQSRVATLFARLLLPEIVFYGVGAMLGAVLNTRGSFGPPAWAPVLNNVVVIVTAGVFFIMPGPKSLDIATITLPQVVVLGVGTTLGIVAQTAVLIPYVRRVGFRFQWRFDIRRSGLGQDTPMLLWVIGYVVVSQIGYATIVRLADGAGRSSGVGYAVYANAALVFQMPYGIIGVALLTALLPRMSRSAAVGDLRRLVADLSLGGRLTAVGLVPVTAAFIVLGPAITVAIFAHGHASLINAHATGVALAWSAFGLLPYAMTLLQLRAFYAVKDAKTPTLINVGIVAVKVVLSLLVPVVLPDQDVVTGLAVVNSVSFVVGAVLGEALLRRRFGPIGTDRLLRTTFKLAVASAVGGVIAWASLRLITDQIGYGRAGSTLSTVVGATLGGLAALLIAIRLRVEELHAVAVQLRQT